MTDCKSTSFVSRAGLKLDHALRAFKVDVTGWVCADFGCNIGGFTDCLLQHGVARVFAIDTGYGTLAYKLRIDPRVVVMERTNALYALPPAKTPPDTPPETVPDTVFPNAKTPSAMAQKTVPDTVFSADTVFSDLVVIDLAWTPQRLAIPAALKWLKTDGRIITLVKPHYELSEDEKASLLTDGRLDPHDAERVLHRVLEAMPALGARPMAHTLSPITGGKSAKKAHGAGNVEYLVLVQPE